MDARDLAPAPFFTENGYTTMPAKQKCIGWLVGILLCNVLKAQLPLPVNAPCGGSATVTGVVNTYYPALTDANAGDFTISLGPLTGNARPIVAGDRVLIIQMQDATINSSNTVAYGGNGTGGNGYTDLGYTGLYEFAIVRSLAGNVLTLRDPLQRSYRAISGIPNRKSAYQVVRVPAYQVLTLGGPVTAAPWDGTAGGIVALHAWRFIDMNGFSISVTGQGFRPGRINSAGGLYNLQDFVRPTYGSYGEKGEGIAGTPEGTWAATAGGYENGSFGRGAPANAGGGGNAHNSGGGGGANFGNGGKGGFQYGGADDVGGRGGVGVKTGLPVRIMMGGGGGSGHQNNAAASGGEHGGGIVLVTTGDIIGAGSISADGNNAGPSTDDGAGGGGAGGSIILSYTGAMDAGITLSAKGGAGGNETFLARHGCGGGAGGGVIVTSTPVAATDVSGGLRGLSNGTEYGAVDGEPGTVLSTDLSSLQPATTQLPFLQVRDATVCQPATVDLSGTDVITGRDLDPEFVLSYWTDLATTVPVLAPRAVNSSGTYYIKLTNTNTNCETVAAVQITVYPQPVLTLTATPPSCTGSADGSIQTTPGNGAGPYQYSTDGGLTWLTAVPGNLAAGTYTILVQDSYGCISQPTSITLADPPVLTLREEPLAHRDASCYGLRDGQLQFIASGGTNGYQYTITSPATGSVTNNTGLFTGLPAGSYAVTVTDASQCSQGIPAVILEPPALLLQVKDTTVCQPAAIDITSPAIITTRSQGPEFVLSYWTNAAATVPLPNPRAVTATGTYYIKLTNTTTNCELVAPVQVTLHPQPVLTLTAIPPSCAGSANGSIRPMPGNGAGPYQFSSDGGLTWLNIVPANLPAGTYTVIVKDSYGCISEPASVTLADPPLLTLREVTGAHTDLSCYGGRDGQLQFSAAGGTNGYKYTINSPATGNLTNTTGLFTGLPAGSYSVTVTDAAFCTQNTQAVVLEPTQLILTLVDKTELECDALPKGRITLSASGGVPPYSYSIGNDNWQGDSIFLELGAGRYAMMARDRNNCLTDPLVTDIAITEGCEMIFPSAFSPNGDGLNDLFRPKNYKHASAYRLSVYNRWGAIIFQANDPAMGWDGRFKGALLDAGTFVWIATFTNRHGQSQTLKGTVTLVK